MWIIANTLELLNEDVVWARKGGGPKTTPTLSCCRFTNAYHFTVRTFSAPSRESPGKINHYSEKVPNKDFKLSRNCH